MAKRYIDGHLLPVPKKNLSTRGLVQFLASLLLLLGVFLLPTVSGASCGDNICNLGENSTSCAADCGSYLCDSPIDCAYVQRANGTYIEYLQFLSGGAGILIWDRDENGIVNAEDFFGGRDLTERDVDNAFEDLALLDSNGDGIVNSSDDDYANLKIWRRNSTSLELVPLNNTNVSYIRLAYRDTDPGGADPIYWKVLGTYNSSEFIKSDPVAVGVNFTINLFGNFASGDFLVLDLDNSSTINNSNISTNTCTQCSTPITINLESPANNTEESSDSTPSFTFNATDNGATVNCTLQINVSGTASPYANNVSVLNVTSTILIANASLSNDDYYWWVDCSDDSGAPVSTYTSVKRFITLIISAIVPDNSPSGQQSGGSSLNFKKYTFTEIIPEKALVIKDIYKESGVKDIQIQVSGEVKDVKITVSKYDIKPANVSIEKSGKVHKYFQIETENLEDNLEKFTLKIQVEKTWIANNGFELDDVALFKFDEKLENWNELTTVFSGEDDSYYLYDIELDSFGFFVISHKSFVEPVDTEGKQDDEGEENLAWLWILIGVLVVFVMLKKRLNN